MLFRNLKIGTALLTAVLLTVVGYQAYIERKYPWEHRISSTGIDIPRGSVILHRAERSAVFGSTFSYVIQLPPGRHNCRSLGLGVHEGELVEVMDEAKADFWKDLGGEKKGTDLCYRYDRSPGKIVVAWAHGDRVLLDIEL